MNIISSPSLQSKVALVTGGSREIGSAIADTYLSPAAKAQDFLRTDEIDGLISNLAEPDGGFITGASLTIDGGIAA